MHVLNNIDPRPLFGATTERRARAGTTPPTRPLLGSDSNSRRAAGLWWLFFLFIYFSTKHTYTTAVSVHLDSVPQHSDLYAGRNLQHIILGAHLPAQSRPSPKGLFPIGFSCCAIFTRALGYLHARSVHSGVFLLISFITLPHPIRLDKKNSGAVNLPLLKKMKVYHPW